MDGDRHPMSGDEARIGKDGVLLSAAVILHCGGQQSFCSCRDGIDAIRNIVAASYQ